MDMELAMRQALGDTVTYEHTDLRAGVKAMRYHAEAKPIKKKRYEPADPVTLHTVDRSIASTYRPLFRAVAHAHGLDAEFMLKASRNPQAVMGRAHFAWELQRRTGMSLTWVGKQMGGVRHTTILHYMKKFNARVGDYTAHIERVKEAHQ